MNKLRTIASTLMAILLAAVAMAAERRGPFAQPPRSVRSRTFDQQHLRLELDFDFHRREIQGRAIHTLTPFEPVRRIAFDAVDMKIARVGLADGKRRAEARKLTFETRDGQLFITLDRTYKPGETIRLAVDYLVSEPQQGAHFVVPDANQPDQPRMVWTQSQPEMARYWFPCFDSPTDRLTSEILATVPADFFVLSNGVLKSKKDNGDGTRTWHWAQEQSHVTYLMSVAAGRFEAYRQQWDGIPVVSYVPAGRLDDAARSFEKTPAMMAFYSEKIGYRYAWPKYTQICVDEYGGGGMEHTSATTLTTRTLHDERAHLDTSSDGLVAHELVHQWWGDLLTCKDWAELWLNESFATYFATLWIEHDRGRDEATWRLVREAESVFAEDKDRYRRPIVTYGYEKPGNMFDRHCYPKGGRVLHMLRFVLGDELFWKAIRHYCHKHAFDTVETADFRTAIEEATGRGLNWFFDQWIYHGGYPEFEVAYEWDDRQKTVRLTVKQTQQLDELTPLFRMPVEIELVTPGETVRQRILVSKAEETFHFALKQRPRRVCFDPQDWILKKLTFEKSQQEWLDQAAHDAHLICRVRAVRGLAKFDKDQDVLAALAKVAAGDKFWGVRQETVKSLGNFRGPAARDALLRAAKEDPKSFVRREAIKALAAFSDDETRQTLRHVIEHDRSYEAVAEALRTLLKVDRDECRPDLLLAIKRTSHQGVILKAAAEGLAELNDRDAATRLQAIADGPSPPRRRAAVLVALGQLSGGKPEVTETLARFLDSDRWWVRRAAVEALGKTGDPGAIQRLTARRDKETKSRVIYSIDDALTELRKQQEELGKLRKEVETLRKEHRQLKQRLGQ